jgi:hypothetical protein
MKDSELMAVIFTTEEAPGAWPNGTPVCKVNSQPGDATPDGTIGLVLGSIAAPPLPGFGYFVIWATRPGVPVFCADTNRDGTPRLRLDNLQ